MIELNKIYNEECLVGMQRIEDKSIDMILCDLPYGTTNCAWDAIIPFDKLWEQYERIIKDNGAIVLTAAQPFTSLLVCSNLEMFKYEWIWDKILSTGFLNANKRPLVKHESVLVFSKSQSLFNKQYSYGKPYGKRFRKDTKKNQYGAFKSSSANNLDGKRNPTSIIDISNANRIKNGHPTQKPVALFEYLIKTYTNEGDLVLDNCMGSATTAIASINTKRNYIGFELDKEYYDLSTKRIFEHQQQLRMF